MKKKTKVIVSSVMTMGLCASLIAGSTLALFSSESNVNIAITSGKVDVEASVKALSTYSNAKDNIDIGDIKEWKDATSGSGDGSFTGNFETGGQATYAVKDGAGALTLNQIAPGDAVKFKLSVENKSTISVKYQIRMLAGEEKYAGEGTDPLEGTKLSSVLEVKIGENEAKTGLVYADSPWSKVLEAKTSIPETEVIIRLPKDAGNEYQKRSCPITLTVLAVQGNARETTYCDEHGHKYEGESCIYCGEKNPFATHHTEEGNTYTINGVDEDATELYIPGEIDGKKVELAKDAFYGNTNLTSVKIDEGITSWPEPEKVHGKYQGLFTGCTNLEHVELPDSLTKISQYSFSGCSALQDIEIPENVTTIECYAFSQTGLDSIDIPENVTSIGYYAFYSTKLESVEIPDSVTTLEYGTFSYCKQLTSVTLGDGITKIMYNTFSQCTSLKNIELGNAVTEIEHTAFSGTALTTFTMPDSLTTLGYSAFYQCASLESVIFDENIETIDHNAFDGCTSLKTVTLNGTHLTTIGQYAFYNCKTLTEINIPGSLTSVGARIFQGCTNLANVTFGEGLQTISTSMFESCSALTEIRLPDSVTTIGNGAFYNCGLTTVYIGTSESKLSNIDLPSAFLFCSKLKDIYFAGSRDAWNAAGGNKINNITVHCSDDQ